MAELPRSLPEFEARFPDDAACARWLLGKRWPDGFRCPACGHTKGWELGRERLTLRCAACERQVSVTAGTVPTLSRWIRGGTHTLHEWRPKLPATTPASQMGILHGVIDGIPAFRWYDRANDKVMVANRPADAAVIEETLERSDVTPVRAFESLYVADREARRVATELIAGVETPGVRA